MDISEILSIALPVVYVIVGAVLGWAIYQRSPAPGGESHPQGEQGHAHGPASDEPPSDRLAPISDGITMPSFPVSAMV